VSACRPSPPSQPPPSLAGACVELPKVFFESALQIIIEGLAHLLGVPPCGRDVSALKDGSVDDEDPASDSCQEQQASHRTNPCEPQTLDYGYWR
jgi:hypothetical protein